MINAQNHTVNGSIVKFGVNQGAFSANGTMIPPKAVAFHELQHAAEAEYARPLVNVPRGRFGNKFEERAVNQVETEVLQQDGLSPRDAYVPGFLYQTKGLNTGAPYNSSVAEALAAKQPALAMLTEKLNSFGVDQANPPEARTPLDPERPQNGAEALSARDSEMRKLRAEVEALEGRPGQGT